MALTLNKPAGRDSSGRVIYRGTERVGLRPRAGGGFERGVTETTVDGITTSVPGSVTGRSLSEQKQVEAIQSERERVEREKAQSASLKAQAALISAQRRLETVRASFASSNLPQAVSQQQASQFSVNQAQALRDASRMNQTPSGQFTEQPERYYSDEDRRRDIRALKAFGIEQDLRGEVQPFNTPIDIEDIRGVGLRGAVDLSINDPPSLETFERREPVVRFFSGVQESAEVNIDAGGAGTQFLQRAASSFAGTGLLVTRAVTQSPVQTVKEVGTGVLNFPVALGEFIQQPPAAIAGGVFAEAVTGVAAGRLVRSTSNLVKDVYVKTGARFVEPKNIYGGAVTAGSTEEALRVFTAASQGSNRFQIVTVGPGKLEGRVFGSGRKGGLPTPLEDPGPYFGPAGSANPQFFRFADEASSSYTFNPAALFDFNVPTISRTSVKGIGIQPSSVLAQPGFFATRDFLATQVNSDLAFVTKRGMIGKGEVPFQRFTVTSDFESPIAQTVTRGSTKLKTTSFKEGDILITKGTSEIEVVMSPDTSFSYRAKSFIGRLKGFDEYTVYNGRNIALRDLFTGGFPEGGFASASNVFEDFTKASSSKSLVPVSNALVPASSSDRLITSSQLISEAGYLSSRPRVPVLPVVSPVPSGVRDLRIQSPSLSADLKPLSPSVSSSSPARRVSSPAASRVSSSPGGSASSSSSIYRSISPSSRVVSPSVVSLPSSPSLSVSVSPISSGSPLSPSTVLSPGSSLVPGSPSKVLPLTGKSPFLPPDTPFVPKPLLPPFRPDTDRRSPEFEVVVGSKDNKFFFNVGKGGKEVIEKGRRLVKDTAAASVTVRRLRPGRGVDDVDVRSVLGRGFSKSRTKKDTFVQDVRDRITTAGEKKQIPGEARRINLIKGDFFKATKLQERGFSLRSIRKQLRGGF